MNWMLKIAMMKSRSQLLNIVFSNLNAARMSCTYIVIYVTLILLGLRKNLCSIIEM